MTPSTYRVAVTCPLHTGRRLLYSTIRRSIVRVSDATLRRFKTGRLSASDAALFRRLGLLVENAAAERDRMRGYFDRLNRLPGALDLTVVMTMACNFACPYCFEGDLKGDRRLSSDTADRLLDFTARRLDPEAVTGLRVTFYGGEPLLAGDALWSLAKRFKDLADARSAPFSFGMITNGALLTPKLVDALLPLGFETAQVTLDGPARLHRPTPIRRRRPGRRPRPLGRLPPPTLANRRMPRLPLPPPMLRRLPPPFLCGPRRPRPGRLRPGVVRRRVAGDGGAGFAVWEQ